MSATDDFGYCPACNSYVIIGTEEGDTCNRGGCDGTMGFAEVKDCSCHLHPPCDACANNPIVCLKCGANPDED